MEALRLVRGQQFRWMCSLLRLQCRPRTTFVGSGSICQNAMERPRLELSLSLSPISRQTATPCVCVVAKKKSEKKEFFFNIMLGGGAAAAGSSCRERWRLELRGKKKQQCGPTCRCTFDSFSASAESGVSNHITPPQQPRWEAIPPAGIACRSRTLFRIDSMSQTKLWDRRITSRVL